MNFVDENDHHVNMSNDLLPFFDESFQKKSLKKHVELKFESVKLKVYSIIASIVELSLKLSNLRKLVDFQRTCHFFFMIHVKAHISAKRKVNFSRFYCKPRHGYDFNKERDVIHISPKLKLSPH